MSNIRKYVFLDTSFLEALLNKTREEHRIAVLYFSSWIKNQILIGTSTICLAEYSVKAPELHPIFQQIKIVPFNAEAARFTGELFRRYKGTVTAQMKKDAGYGKRDALKDDFKILAAATMFRASAIVHNDKNTMDLFVKKAIKELPQCRNMSSILLTDGYNAGLAKLGAPELNLFPESENSELESLL